MSDQKRWFKVWTSVISDDDFDCSTQEGRDRLARFVWLGAYAALHGENGVTDIEKTFLLSRLGVTDVSRLSVTLACKNMSFEESTKRHDKFTVTISKWMKFQEDHTAAKRQESRRKRRREEKRGEERRKDTDDRASPVESEHLSVKDFVDSWNDQFTGKLPTVTWPLSESRKRHLTARLKEHRDQEDKFWTGVFTNINTSVFLLGNGTATWQCTLDFLIANDTNCVKIFEGAYNHAQNQSRR